VRHPYSSFHNLIFNIFPTTLYFSFPISKTRNNPAYVEEINNVRVDLHNIIESNDGVLFDPVTIDELPTNIFDSAKSNDPFKFDSSSRWPIDANGLSDNPEWPVEISCDEVTEAREDIKNQVRVRDFKLIDNSQFTVVYKPNFGGFSVGVNYEITYTSGQAKRVYVFQPKDNGTSATLNPFHTHSIPIEDYEEFKKRILEYLNLLKTQNAKRALT
jgi:hypothetical protein